MSHIKFSKIFLLLSWSAMIFTATGLPMRHAINDYGFSYYDKAIHIVLFAIFAHLVVWTLKEWKHHPKHMYWAAFLGTFFFALAMEVYQAFVPGRTPDMPDLIAGVMGAGLAVINDYVLAYKPKPGLLLHICCIGCGAYVSDVLKNDYEVTLFFYNPNIFPQAEYDKRLEETKRIARKFGLKIIEGENNHKKWLEMAKGHETDKEKGERCVMCYRDRLEATARLAREKGFRYFTTTLTISPHKDAKAVSAIGQDLEKRYGVGFLDRDFKKKDGFKLSTKLSRELGLYRQDYCGCEFSRAYSKCEACS